MLKQTNRTVVNNSGWWRFLSLVGKITPWISQLYNFCFSRAINVFYPTMRQIILCLGDQTMRSMLSQELRLLSILLVAKMLGILISIKTPIIKTHFILWVKLGVRFCQLLAASSTCLWWDLDVDEASSATVNQLTMISICLREQRRILEHEYLIINNKTLFVIVVFQLMDENTGSFFLFHSRVSVARCQPYAKREKLVFWCLRYRSLGYWGFVRW